MQYKSINNPLEIKSAHSMSVVRQKKVRKILSVEAHLECAKERFTGDSEDVYDPLKLFEPYSVYKITLINKFSDTDKQFVTANIPVTALGMVERRTQAATTYIMESEMTKTEMEDEQEEKEVSLAYTVSLAIGSFKNKTPAMVLLENPSNREALQRTANWLKERLDSHANNKKQYDAICEALSLLDTNELKSGHKSKCRGIKIYEADLRTQTGKKRADGKTFVYGIRVMCYPEKRYPYEISIINYWADCRGIQPIEGTIQDSTTITMNLSEADWDDTVDQMRNIKDIFMRCYGKYELERALNDFKTKQCTYKRKGA